MTEEIKINFDQKEIGINEISDSRVLNRAINSINERRFISFNFSNLDISIILTAIN